MATTRSSRAAYRCTGCKIKRSGAAGMVACPECGAALTRLYAPRRKPPPPKRDAPRGD